MEKVQNFHISHRLTLELKVQTCEAQFNNTMLNRLIMEQNLLILNSKQEQLINHQESEILIDLMVSLNQDIQQGVLQGKATNQEQVDQDPVDQEHIKVDMMDKQTFKDNLVHLLSQELLQLEELLLQLLGINQEQVQLEEPHHLFLGQGQAQDQVPEQLTNQE